MFEQCARFNYHITYSCKGIIFALKAEFFLFLFFRATLESSTETKGMAKECIPGQMAQNLKVTLKMTRKKDLECLFFPVVINLRFVHDIKLTFFFTCTINGSLIACL